MVNSNQVCNQMVPGEFLLKVRLMLLCLTAYLLLQLPPDSLFFEKCFIELNTAICSKCKI